jgi:diacylglycerol O-acyltransferase
MKALSPSDSVFLLLEGRRQPMHVGGLQLLTPPADAGDDFVGRVFAAIRENPMALPPFNQHLKMRFGHWHWTQDQDFDIEHHVRHSALPRPGRIRELLALVSRLHGTLLDRSRPLWETHLIEGLADGRVAVYSKVHHALFDGVSAMRTMHAALSENVKERDRPPFWQYEKPRRARSHRQVAAAPPMQALAQAVRSNARIIPGVARGLWDLVRHSDDPADVTPMQAPPSMLNVRISGARRFAAQSYAFSRIQAICKRHRATINDVSLAICAGALREYLLSHDALPETPLIAMVPVSVRAADGPDDGNQISLILANLGTHIADPAERLATIVASTRHAKARMTQMTRIEQIAYAAAVASPLPASSLLGFDRIHPVFNLVISNVPGPTKPLYWNGAHVDEMYPVSIPIDGQALNITLTSYCDQVAFGFTACRRALPQMQRLLDYSEAALEALEA